MPVNSFENYYMSWKPDKSKLKSPIYVTLADMMEQDIKNGVLLSNTKLPPQRELADFLDLNLTTITKAYKLCEKRGLIHAVVGKGSFISPYVHVNTSIVEKNINSKIELATIRPYDIHSTLIRDVSIEVLKRPFSEKLFEYYYPLGDFSQIQIASKWLKLFGIDANENNTLITAGAQNALAIILSSLFEAGDKIAVDCYTYPNFRGLANLLHIQLISVMGDENGMLPEAFENACIYQKIKGVYVMPTGNNPTNIAFSETRRKEIAEIIKKYHVIAIEDDNYTALIKNAVAPLTLEAPEHGIFISGISKPLCPALRIAYMYVPQKYISVVEKGAFSQNLKISSLNMEIAAELIRSELYKKMIKEKRELSIQRNQIYHTIFPYATVFLESYCQWLELPENCSGVLCERELIKKGINVFGAERFSVGEYAKNNYIRIATCSPENTEQLKEGLTEIKNFISHYSKRH